MSNDNQNDRAVPKIPSEYRLSLKWENAFKRFGTSVSIGSIGCGLASIVIFRGFAFRFALTTFGAGFGAGIAYKDTVSDFNAEITPKNK